MSYYKYLPPQRVDILENLKIRFTQVSALNDPFEGLPAVLADGQTSGREQALDIEWVQSRIRLITENTTGILSLSKCSDNILMWSHYASSHRGFVIEFDSTHEFFIYGTQAVRYSRKRPVITTRPGWHNADILTTKSPDWAYEQEVRKTKPLRDDIIPMENGNTFIRADPNAREDPHKLHLFDLPQETIKGVILGWKSDDALLMRIRSAIQKHKMNSIRIAKAIPSADEFSMSIVSLVKT